jgi:ribonuclease BN (tRNA processing enzyme)
MKVQVLGASGSVGRGRNTAAFLLDEFLLLDAGSVSRALTSKAQSRISHILLSHAHLDHIKSIPFLIDNINTQKQKKSIAIYSGREVIQDLKRHIFNNRIWPDFSVIPSPEKALIRFQTLSTKGFISIRGYRIYAFRVDHTVPAYGYLIEDAAGNCLMYSGDSGPTEKIWQAMKGHRVKALIIEVSFPNALRKLALLSGHLTPALLKQEIKKMTVLPEKLFITHTKSGYLRRIERELQSVKGVPWEILHDGMEFIIS